MDGTVEALRALYVAFGGNEDDVKGLVIIPDLINAIANLVHGSPVLPADPSSNGTYVLQCVKSNSGAVKSWQSST